MSSDGSSLSREFILVDILREIPVNLIENDKRKDHDSSVVEPAAKKRAAMISNVMMEKLKKENAQLKKEIQRYKDHWMREFFFSHLRIKMFAFRSAKRPCHCLLCGNRTNTFWCISTCRGGSR